MQDKTQRKESQMKDSKRVVYLDIIRIVAVLMVIFCHTGDIGNKLYTVNVNLVSRGLALALDVFRCVNVNLFFMVSGALILKKDISYKDLITKYVMRYIVIIVAIEYFYWVVYFGRPWYDIKELLTSIYHERNAFHLWYLYYYIGYLLILPFLRKLVKVMNRADYKYLLIMGILFLNGFRVFEALTGLGSFGIGCAFTAQNIFFPIIGYYIANVISDEECKIKYVGMGMLVTAICIMLTMGMMILEMVENDYTFKDTYLTSLNVLPSIAVFYAVRTLCIHISIPNCLKQILTWGGQIHLARIYSVSGFKGNCCLSIKDLFVG